MATNLESSYHISQLAHPLLKAFEAGSIVFISSVVGLVHVSVGSVYSAVKAALNQLTKNLACEWANDNIQTNCVAPWFTKTSLIEEADPEFCEWRMGHALRLSLLLILLAIVKQWASSSLHSDTKDGHILKDLLFFLHVPRTGARTYFYCPRSYDKLQFNPQKQGYRLLVTQCLRNPIERVFSAYEFSIEVDARFLVHLNLTLILKMSSRIRSKNGGISTLEIWPWKYLVPWMREDLFTQIYKRCILHFNC
ncbi:hypothetical protein Lser_V15G06676 [Lactuca serriola]